MRNILAFPAMMLLCWGSFEGLYSLIEPGIERLSPSVALIALYGAAGYFAFAGKTGLRVLLVFCSVIALGAAAVVFRDDQKTFYPLLTSIPVAAIAAAVTAVVGRYMRNRAKRKLLASRSWVG